jgi:hypothetical protein
MNVKALGASAPVTQEPSDKIADARSLSGLIRGLFFAAKPSLSRNDFEKIAYSMEAGIQGLHNLQRAVEAIGCDFDPTAERPSMMRDYDSLKSFLFHVSRSINAAQAQIETAREAAYCYRNYEEHLGGKK